MSTSRSRLLAMTLAASALLAAAPLTTQAQSPAMPSGAATSPVTVTDANGKPVVIADASRTVALGGPVTEVVYALGAQDQLVGVDASSSYPAQALTDKANVGYYRILTAEPVLATNPTLVLGTTEAGPPDVISQIEAAGVTTLILPVDNSVAGAKAKITAIGQALGKDAEAAALVTTLESDLANAATLVGTATTKPSVLFVLVAGPGTVLVAGSGTEAQTMIEAAGGTNAATGFTGLVPLTPEAALAANPDVILTMDSGLKALGGVDGFLALPGLAETPAGKAKRVVSLEDQLLLGFGPRLGQGVADLARLIHPELPQQ
jgi:iron complex transport system substrate-binding protein